MIGGRVPIVRWARAYRRRDARFDIVAGVTVSALVVPKALGYAGIAGIPIERGLYAAAAGCLIYAIFGTSRQISTGPSSALAAIAASAAVLSGVAVGQETWELVAAITLLTGVLFVVAAALKLGWLSRLLSKAVITGFLFGAAIDVVIGELPKLTGTSGDGTNSWRQLIGWVQGVDEVHWLTIAVGGGALAVVLTLHVAAPKVPGALVLVVGGLVISRVFDLADHGVATVGQVPRGLPSPELPPASMIGENASTIVVAAVALFLIGFSQTAGDGRLFAARHRYAIDVDQEMVAQGMSNIGAGVFQGMPVSTSLSASSLNDSSGARTQLASVVTGGIVVLTLLILAPLFSDLPKPVLAAIIIDAVVFGMMDVPEMRRLWRVKRVDFWIAMLAIVGVLSAGVLAGVVIGIALSLAWLLYVSATPAVTELARQPGTTAFRSIEEFPEGERVPGVIVVRFDGGLTFVTSASLGDDITRRLDEAGDQVAAVVVDFAGVNFIDSQGSDQIDQLLRLAKRDGWSLRLARVRGDVRAVLDADGIIDRLGRRQLHSNVDTAVEAEIEARTSVPPGPAAIEHHEHRDAGGSGGPLG